MEALSLAYESKPVFDHIRSRVFYVGEDADTPVKAGEDDEHKKQRGTFYAVLKRIEANRDYFARVWKLQPKFVAIFGEETADIFDQLHAARRNIEVTASTLVWEDEPYDRNNPEYKSEMMQHRKTIFGGIKDERDPVGDKLENFRKRISELCRPVVDRQYRLSQGPWWAFWR